MKNAEIITLISSDMDKYHENWVDFLCSKGNRHEYQQVEEKSKSAMFAIMTYRRLLRSRGLGNIPIITINTAHTQENYIKLHSLLQELFLEYITEDQFEYVLNELEQVENGIAKLYEKHLQDKNARILNRVLLL